jgi:hypothetical protein
MTTPQFDIGAMIVAAVASVLMGVDVLTSEDNRKLGVFLLFLGLVNFTNAYRVWRFLPEQLPVRFTVRRLLVVMTILAIALTIMRAVE